MSLDRYEPLFFNANFKEAASDASLVAYRGELILQEGEVADARAAASRLLKCSSRPSCSVMLRPEADFRLARRVAAVSLCA
jgi:hypothetical protein